MSGSLQPVTLASLLPIARASNAWRFNASGVLEQIGADIARLDHDPATLARRGLLIEPQATNFVLNPRGEGLVPGTPGTVPTNWSVTAGALLAETSAQTINGIPGVAFRFTGTPTGTGPQSISWSSGSALPAGGTVGAVYCRMLAGTLANVSGDAGTLLRILVSGAATAVASTLLATLTSGQIAQPVIYRVAAGGESLQVRWNYVNTTDPVNFTWWFGYPQLQQPASSAASLSSPIQPPVSSPAASTRLADSLVRTLGVAEFSPQGFTLVAEGLVAAQAEVARHLLALDDDTANNAVAIRIPAGSSAVQLVVVNGGVETVTALGSLTPGAPFRVAARCAPGAFLASLNGGAAAGNAAAMPPLTRLRAGRLGSSGTLLRGHLRLATLSRGLRAAAVLPALSVPGAAYL